MIRVNQFRSEVDRAREEINDPRVFDEVMRQTLFEFESACAKASFPEIVDDPSVVAACDSLTKGTVGLLHARAVAAKAYPWKLRAANREIDKAALVAHTAHDNLEAVVKRAMTEKVGFDGTHENWLDGLMKHFDERS